MKQYTLREFTRIVILNGFYFNRNKGDHKIYVNSEGKHISIPNKLKSVIARRLIKENKLNTNLR